MRCRSVGQVYFGLRQYDMAILYYTKALDLRTALADRFAASECYKNLGTAHFRLAFE